MSTHYLKGLNYIKMKHLRGQQRPDIDSGFFFFQITRWLLIIIPTKTGADYY